VSPDLIPIRAKKVPDDSDALRIYYPVTSGKEGASVSLPTVKRFVSLMKRWLFDPFIK